MDEISCHKLVQNAAAADGSILLSKLGCGISFCAVVLSAHYVIFPSLYFFFTFFTLAGKLTFCWKEQNYLLVTGQASTRYSALSSQTSSLDVEGQCAYGCTHTKYLHRKLVCGHRLFWKRMTAALAFHLQRSDLCFL